MLGPTHLILSALCRLYLLEVSENLHYLWSLVSTFLQVASSVYIPLKNSGMDRFQMKTNMKGRRVDISKIILLHFEKKLY